MQSSGTDKRLVSAFLEMMSAERGASVNTLAAYGQDLEAYCSYLNTQRKPLAYCGTVDLRNWLAAMQAEGLAKSTIARRLSAVRQLHRFAFAEGVLTDDPASVVAVPRKARTLPKVLSVRQAEAAAGSQAAIGAGARKAAKQGVATALLAGDTDATGMRVSELVSLTIGMVVVDERFITVRGKGGRERLVPLSPAARSAINALLAALRQANDEKPLEHGSYLFAGSGHNSHLTRQHFALSLKQLAGAAGLETQAAFPRM